MTYFFYIFLNYIKLVLSALLLCLGLFILFDYMQKVTPPSYFGSYTFDLGMIAQYYSFQMPFQIIQFLPLVSLLGSSILISTMTFRSENIVLRSFGVGPWKMLPPLFVGGGTLILVSILLSELLVPHSVKKLKYINEVVFKRDNTDVAAKKYFWIKNGNKVLKFQHYDQNKKKLVNVELLELDADFKPVQVISANSATFMSRNKQWFLSKVKVISFQSENNHVVEKNLPQLFLSFLSIDFNLLRFDTENTDKMSLNRLAKILSLKKEYSLNSLEQRVLWHSKLSYQIVILLFSLIGIKFAFYFNRNRDWTSDFIFVSVIAFSYWITISVGKALSLSGTLDPIWVSWGSALFVLCLLIYQVIISDKKIKN